MFRLNLPSIKPNLKNEDKKTLIFDPLRKRYVRLTPEEWVRQNFVSFLIKEKGYSPTLIANEITIELNGMTRRCDSIVYNHDLQPLAIIEYKAPSVNITQKTFEQAEAYNHVLRVPYIIISNGLRHFCCHLDYETHSCQFLRDIPTYQELMQG